MFAICIESSHQKGMGHLFRMLNLIEHFDKQGEKYVVLINEDKVSNTILRNKEIPYYTVDLEDDVKNWEKAYIRQFKVKVWLNDRLNTSLQHAKNIRAEGIGLVTFDDLGEGSSISHINFASLPCIFNKNPMGEQVYCGTDYLILNQEICQFKRTRDRIKRILVTLGGSDTYGATVKVVELLKRVGTIADIIIGPSFLHREQLWHTITNGFTIKESVPSLIKEFYDYDFAITGGGVTAFEANASGLPCAIVANELHEIDNAKYLHNLESSFYIGHHTELEDAAFQLDFNIEAMSRAGLTKLHVQAVDNIYAVLQKLKNS